MSVHRLQSLGDLHSFVSQWIVVILLMQFNVGDAQKGGTQTCSNNHEVDLQKFKSQESCNPDYVIGRVRLCDGGEWKSTVCDHQWTVQDAMVVCRELGYNSEGAVALTLNQITSDSMSSVVPVCTGTEKDVFSCSFEETTAITSCPAGKIASVACPLTDSAPAFNLSRCSDRFQTPPPVTEPSKEPSTEPQTEPYPTTEAFNTKTTATIVHEKHTSMSSTLDNEESSSTPESLHLETGGNILQSTSFIVGLSIGISLAITLLLTIITVCTVMGLKKKNTTNYVPPPKSNLPAANNDKALYLEILPVNTRGYYGSQTKNTNERSQNDCFNVENNPAYSSVRQQTGRSQIEWQDRARHDNEKSPEYETIEALTQKRTASNINYMAANQTSKDALYDYITPEHSDADTKKDKVEVINNPLYAHSTTIQTEV